MCCIELKQILCFWFFIGFKTSAHTNWPFTFSQVHVHVYLDVCKTCTPNLFRSRGELNPTFVGVRVVRHDGTVVARSFCNLSSVPRFLLESTHDSSLRH